jgi:hypothetical protein
LSNIQDKWLLKNWKKYEFFVVNERYAKSVEREHFVRKTVTVLPFLFIVIINRKILHIKQRLFFRRVYHKRLA